MTEVIDKTISFTINSMVCKNETTTVTIVFEIAFSLYAPLYTVMIFISNLFTLLFLFYVNMMFYRNLSLFEIHSAVQNISNV